MAKLVLTNAMVLINAVDLSDHVDTVTVNYSAAEVDSTSMGQAGLSRLGGLKDWSLDVIFAQDYAAAKVDATLFPLVGTQVPIEVRPTNAARSATNPAYTGNGLLGSYSPMGQKVGALNVAPIKISGADGVALARQIV
jgi:hypothetical protein